MESTGRMNTGTAIGRWLADPTGSVQALDDAVRPLWDTCVGSKINVA